MRIVTLTDEPEHLATLTRLYVETWQPFYGLQGPGEARADLKETMADDGLPLCLVALENDDIIGTVCVRTESISHQHLGPWITGHVVTPEHRGQGHGATLIDAAAECAHRLGYNELYISTQEDEHHLLATGWTAIDDTKSLRGRVTVYKKTLKEAPEAPAETK